MGPALERPTFFHRPATAAAMVLLAMSLACGQASTVDAPAPTPVVDTGVDSLPTLPPSLVDAPITYDLSPALAALESAVPRKFGDINARRRSTTNRRVNTAFAAEREPFQVRFDGGTVRVRTVLEYQGKGWYNAPLSGDLFGSCGMGVTRPRAVVELATTLRMTPDWRLRGKSEITRVEPFSTDKRDQCKVTVFKIDVTDRVVTAARSELEKRAVALDQKIASVDVRSPMERWWRVLQRPIRLSDSVWLLLQPKGVHLGPITGSARTVSLDVGLSGEPRVVTGPRPADGTAGLPPLERAKKKHDQALHVLLEGELSYDLANSILRKNVVGKRIRRGARWVTLRDARLSGIGGGRVSLAVRFDGAASGLVYLVGTPRYDPETRQLYVPDLAYDVSSADLLVRGLEFMRRGDVQNLLRTRARFPVADLVEQARERLERGMNRQLGQNATLVAKVATGDVLAVRATATGILVRAAANGNARLEVNRIPALSRQSARR
jgi:hypothetical protein